MRGKVVATKKLTSFYNDTGKNAERDALKKELVTLIVMAEPALDVQTHSNSGLAAHHPVIIVDRNAKVESGKGPATIDRVQKNISALANHDFSEATDALNNRDYLKAIELLKRTLSYDPNLGRARVDLASSYNNLASEQHGLGKYKEAEENYKLALPLMQELCGDDDDRTCLVWQGMTENFIAQDRLGDAEQTASRWVQAETMLDFRKKPVVMALDAYSSILHKENKASLAEAIDAEMAAAKQLWMAGNGPSQ